MRIIGTAVLAIVAVHAAHAFHHHTQILRARSATAALAQAAATCSAPADAITIGVLWPETAVVPIAPVIGHWHATLNAIGY